ncbi:MAG: glycoside hydrolase family 3 N-terminal domain-containing protein [Phycisphaerae bacterium]
MSDARQRWVDDLMGKMNIEQKVGQLLVFGFAGTQITPDQVELIRKYHIGGLRVSLGFRTMNLFNDVKPGTEPQEWTLRSLHLPEGPNRDFIGQAPTINVTANEYAGILNELRDHALDREGSIPLHFTIDQEGSGSDDLLCRTRLFCHPMGFTAGGEPELAYKVAKAIGMQARAVGANMIHSPVLDVNTNPKNPEIGTRAYSDNPDDVIEYATQSVRGFNEIGMISTGKHFPGRGESMADAHWGLPTVDLDLETLEAQHIAPYRKLIAAGMPAIMMAHSLYPALGVTEEPSSCSRKLITEYLRGQLGFEGVITTDNMMMGGLLQKYELREAILKTLQAGCDLVLLRDESPIRQKICTMLVQAVKDGSLPEAEVDEKIKRILGMRWDMGLAGNGGKVDASKAHEPTEDAFVNDVCREAAAKSTLLLRDEAESLPLDPAKKVLLVEQVFPTHFRECDHYCHPGMLWEEMLKMSPNVGSVEIRNVPDEADRQRVIRRLKDDEYDIIVTTNYYYHKAAAAITDLVHEMQKTGKPVVAITNTPYEFAAPPELPTVITSFNPGGRQCLRAVAEILYGKLQPTAKCPVKLG